MLFTFDLNNYEIPYISLDVWGNTKGIFNETPMTAPQDKKEND